MLVAGRTALFQCINTTLIELMGSTFSDNGKYLFERQGISVGALGRKSLKNIGDQKMTAKCVFDHACGRNPGVVSCSTSTPTLPKRGRVPGLATGKLGAPSIRIGTLPPCGGVGGTSRTFRV